MKRNPSRTPSILAIDPGLSGAVACLRLEQDDITVSVADMPVMAKGKRNQVNGAELARIVRELDPTICVVEQVGSMPGQGVASMFSFGHSLGVVHGIIAALELPMVTVTPQVWKKQFGLDKDKERARAKAIQLFPGSCGALARKKDTGRAEALLIALWYAQTHGAAHEKGTEAGE